MKKNLLMAGSVLAVLLIGAPDRLVSAKLRETLSAQAQKPPSRDRKERLMKALKELNNPDPDTRQSAVEHLGQMGDMSVVEPLASALADAHPEVRAQAEKSMWLIWLRSGEPETDKILYLGMELMAAGQLQNAIHAFTRVIERAPKFAEGYNKRATAFYLAGQFEKSIIDCDATIRMNPHHFGALFGKGLNYVRLNDLSKALEAFRKTLRVLPYSESAKNMAEAIERKLKSEGTEL